MGKTSSLSMSTVAAIDGGGIGETFRNMPAVFSVSKNPANARHSARTGAEYAKGGLAFVRNVFALAVGLAGFFITPHYGQEARRVRAIGSDLVSGRRIIVRKYVETLS